MSTDSYIGASDAQQIYPENTVDFISVQVDVSQYRLSQDVPGGYEGNVLVIRNGNVLKPESEYSIDYSVVDLIHNIITFQISLSVSDQIYIIHKGVATYNMSPSPRSVTDDSLSENLRSFIYETFDGGDDEFVLIKQEWHPRSLLVYVNGVVQRPYISLVEGGLPADDGTWDFALVKIDEDTSKIVFTSNTPVGTKNVSILHLAFSTVLRRSDYLTSILLAPNVIEEEHIQNNAVPGGKILLKNDEYLRSIKTDDSPVGILKLDTNNKVDIYDKFKLDSNTLEPVVDNSIDIGSDTKKIKKLWSSEITNSGEIETNDLSVDDYADINNLNVNSETTLKGDVEIGQSVDPVNLQIHGDNVSITANDFTVNGSNLEGVPMGVVLPYYGTGIPNDKWLFCDGDAIPGDIKYQPFKDWLITQGLPSANTPNLKQRFPFGRDSSLPSGQGNSVGNLIGNKTHTHAIESHDHDLTESNVEISDNGHTHNITGSVTIPSHTHYLNSHFHPVASHNHSFYYIHQHSVNFSSQPATTTHTHRANYRVDFPLFGGSNRRNYLVRNETGLLAESISDEIPGVDAGTERHRHNIIGNTRFSISPAPQDWGFASGGDGGFRTTASNSTTTSGITSGMWNPTPSPGQNITDNTRPWNRTRYNRSDETDPGNMSTQPGTSVSITSGAASISEANCAISGKTELKADLLTNSNSDFTVPGFTLNFIIKAIA